MTCVSRLRLYQQARAVTAASSPGRRYPSNRAPLPSPARCCPARRYRKLGHGCHIFAPLSALRRFFFSGAQHSPPGQKPCTAGRWTSLILLLGFYTRQPGKKIIQRPLPTFDVFPENQAAAVDHIQLDLRIRRNQEYQLVSLTRIHSPLAERWVAADLVLVGVSDQVVLAAHHALAFQLQYRLLKVGRDTAAPPTSEVIQQGFGLQCEWFEKRILYGRRLAYQHIIQALVADHPVIPDRFELIGKRV